MSKLIKGYWNCKYCGTTDIDGLVDICPNCGKQKSADVKYFMKETTNVVTDEELEKAGMSRDNCDGNHKDWACAYCGQLNNWGDTICQACGGPKEESTQEYGMAEEPKSEPVEVPVTPPITPKTKKKFPTIAVSIIAAILGIIIFLFYPMKETITITDFSWDRTITIEEMRTEKDSGWSVPSGGRVYDESWEFKEYKQVLDHYETVEVTKSREVISHYETDYSYVDNGDGTFTEVASERPVYTTEYYTETEQQPVYREDPVYATKYYYEIDRWYDNRDYESAGEGQEPYWNTDYTLSSNERDSKREENYYVHYDNNKKEEFSYYEWSTMSVGDGFSITKNRLGMEYSRSETNQLP